MSVELTLEYVAENNKLCVGKKGKKGREFNKSNTNGSRSKEMKQTRKNYKMNNKFNEKGEVKSTTTNLNGRLKRDKREHCLYCEKTITNFSRHIVRNHDNEIDVIKIMTLPKNSKERKILFDELRKKGTI